jgi:hypothetical protein
LFEFGDKFTSSDEEVHHLIRFRKSYAVSLSRKKFKRQLRRRRIEAVIKLKKENLGDQHSSEFIESRCEGQTFNHDSNIDTPCAAAGWYIMFSEYNGRQCQGVESTYCSVHGATCLGSEIEPQSLDDEFTRTVSSNNSISHISQFLFSSEVDQ